MTAHAITEALLMGVGLSMDAMAASMALGAGGSKNFTWKHAVTASLLFGLFQALMPALGWWTSSFCGSILLKFGRILATLLLLYLGVKMLREDCRKCEREITFLQILVLAFATSIDALLVGVGYTCLARTNILPDVIIIGCTTFILSLAGCSAGRLFGMACGGKCNILGGGILILLALKFLLFPA